MDITASPSVRSHAGRMGVSIEEVAAATGRKAIAREDIDNHLAGRSTPGSSSHAAGADQSARYWEVDHSQYGPVREETVSRIGRFAADNLSAANTLIPQVTHHDRVDMRTAEDFRKKMRTEADKRGLRLTALAFHVKTLACCLREFKRFNASLSPDGETLYLKDYVHIGIAVDTPHGLMVPIIRDVDRKGLWEIAAAITDLATRAQERKIRPDEMGGASMSISNLGGIGGTAFTPIVNPPEVAILGITRTEIVPVWENEEWKPVPMVPLDLSYDHRAINGADAARFLVHYGRLIGDPRRML